MILSIFSSDCGIQADQVVIENEEQQFQTTIDFNGLILDVNKGTEVPSSESETNSTEEQQIRRIFK